MNVEPPISQSELDEATRYLMAGPQNGAVWCCPSPYEIALSNRYGRMLQSGDTIRLDPLNSLSAVLASGLPPSPMSCL